jgi:hypothetical protein
MINLTEIGEITKIIANLGIFVALVGLFLQRHQFKKMNKLAEKDRFIGSTARYVKIQETLLSKDELSSLNVDICLTHLNRENNCSDNGTAVNTKDKNKETALRLKQLSPNDKTALGKQLALCAIMFQLMEDVWMMHGVNDKKDEKNFAGWNALFCDWMQTPEILKNWELLKHHFSEGFVTAVETNYIGTSTVLPVNKPGQV